MGVKLCSDDSRLGVVHQPCRDGFDFSLLLEQAVLCILPNCVFLTSAAVWCVLHKRAQLDPEPHSLAHVQKITSLALISVNIALLAAWVALLKSDFALGIAASAVQLVACIVASWLSLHVTRNQWLALLLEAFWSFTLTLNAIRLRTVYAVTGSPLLLGLYGADLGARLSCLVLHICCSHIASSSASAEDCAGLWSRCFFVWLNGLFRKGYHTRLDLTSLPQIKPSVSAASCDQAFCQKLYRRIESGISFPLLRTIVTHCALDLLAPVVPRLLFLGTTFAQPFLISRLLGFVNSAQAPNPEPVSHGYGLIAAFALTFGAMAIFSSTYWQYVARFDAKIQALLMLALFDFSMSGNHKEGNDGLTLLSVDLTRISLGIRFLHEFWSAAISVSMAMYLLYRQIGIVFLAPLVVVCICVAFSSWMGRLVPARQMRFMAATQSRISQLTSLVKEFRTAKMLGYESWFEDKITKLRAQEVERQKGYRRILIWTLSVSSSVFQMSSLATFTTFAFVGVAKGYSLNPQLVFTSLAIMKLITSPLLETLQYIAIFSSSLACLVRVERFFLANSDGAPNDTLFDVSFQTWDGDCAITIQHANKGGAQHNVTSCLGSINFIYGQSGCGKTKFIHSLVKAIKSSTDYGTVAMCSQEPWFWTDTIRVNITGSSKFDPIWYAKVLQACCLQEDISAMPGQDETCLDATGTCLSGGQRKRVALARAVYAKSRFVILDDIFAGLDPRLESQLYSRVFAQQGLLSENFCTVFLTTSSEKWLSKASTIIHIASPGHVHQLNPSTFVDCVLDTDCQQDVCLKPSERATRNTSSTKEIEVAKNHSSDSDVSLYLYYLESIGVRYVMIFVTGCAFTIATTILQAWWLKEWASSTRPLQESIQTYLPAFLGISIANFLTLAIFFWRTFEDFSPRASLSLHARLLSSLIRAPIHVIGSMSVGMITSRFSQDLTLLDGRLANSFMAATLMLFTILANTGLFIAATPYFAAIIPALALVLYFIQRVYLRTSRQLRVLELEARAPLCTHLADLSSGLSTIEAFGWHGHFLDNVSLSIKAFLGPFYSLASVQNWLTLVLDLVAASIAVIITGLAVALRQRMSPGYLGLALTGVMDLGFYLRDFVTEWTQLETNLGCVARIRDFTQSTEREAASPSANIDSLQPKSINLHNVSASWSPGASSTIQDMSLFLAAGTRLALVGRSGSGKSTLAALLQGVLRPRRGTILVDELDMSLLPRSELSQLISVLPQDPVLFGETLREVLLLPGTCVEDDAIKKVLQKLGSWQRQQSTAATAATAAAVSSETEARLLEDAAVLAQPIGTISVAEKQLLCVARTLLAPRPILIMDEPASLADEATAKRIHDALDEAFAGATVVAVSHRLDAVLDYDQVLVLDAGRIKETGRPRELLQDEASAFRSLYMAGGYRHS